MAGHSKWNNIKNRKGAVDAKKSKEFAELSKQIRLAAKEGKSDNPDFNPRLRLALDKARAANMPKEKITKAIERGMGRSESGQQVHEVLYEGYGPEGVAILVQAVTDNPTRTSAEMKFIFSRHGGALAGPNAAQFLFTRSEDGTEFMATMPTVVSSEARAQLLAMFEAFETHDDVEGVFHTADLPDAGEAQPE